MHASQEQCLRHLEDLAVEAELRLENDVGAEIGPKEPRSAEGLRPAEAIERVAEPNVLEQGEETVAGACVRQVQAFLILAEWLALRIDRHDARIHEHGLGIALQALQARLEEPGLRAIVGSRPAEEFRFRHVA